jgi:hypothetical protein
MKGDRKTYLNQRLTTSLMALSIASFAFLTYRDVLNYFFTGTDFLTLIDTGRIQSSEDVVRIFTEPLMNGTSFVEESRFYRPIATLSYSLDYVVWKLDPFGYHLTDLILHVSVSVLVFFLIRFLTNGRQGTAWLSALIFTTHPILVECVPAAARHDIIAALFLLLSLLFFFKYLSTVVHKRRYLFFSIFCYALAFGAKEIGIILPFLIFAYLIIFADETFFFKNRIIRAVRVSFPYFVVTVALLAWRTYVLHGSTGGYTQGSLGILGIIRRSARTVREYFIDLLYPFGKSPFHAVPSTFEQIGSLIALFSFFTFLLFYRQALFRLVRSHGGKAMRVFKILLTTVAVSSAVAILSYPLMAPYINYLVQQAYSGKGLKLLAGAMENRGATPVEHYFYEARDQIFRLLSYSFSLSAICLIGLIKTQRRYDIKSLFITDSKKPVVFLLAWLLLPLGIYLFLLEHSHRSMYIPVIPFSAILSVLLVENVQSIISPVSERYCSSGLLLRSLLCDFKSINFMILAGLLISLLIYSPLVRIKGEYGEWRDSGEIWSIFLPKLSKITATLPNEAIIHILNLPERISSYQKVIPHAKSVSSLGGYSIKSWLDLNHPSNRMEVIVPCLSWYETAPDYLDLEIKTKNDNNVIVIVKPNVVTGDCQNVWKSRGEIVSLDLYLN